MAYTVYDDYCDKAKAWQSVPSADDTKTFLTAHGRNASDEAVQNYREGTKYSCDDSYQMGTIQDDHIFVSTTDNQHQQILNGEVPNADGGISGYFTDQATIDNCTNCEVLNNGQLNRELQIAPFQADSSSEPSYKPHIDCFRINPDKLEENYGTRDFNAALAKCDANNQFGEGGGNQGFNPNLSEMIRNGTLEYDKTNSFSDSSLSRLDSKLQNDKTMINSTVSQDTYDGMMQDAKDRATDCVKNNTEHPSQVVNEATGYAHNPNPVEGMTGNGIPIKNNQQNITNQHPNENNQQNTISQDRQSINQTQSNTGKTVTQQPETKNSEGHSSAQGQPSNNEESKSQTTNNIKTESEGMPTTASNLQNSDTNDKRTSSEMSTTNVNNDNSNDGDNFSKGGMPTTAAGQSGSAPSNSSERSHNLEQSM